MNKNTKMIALMVASGLTLPVMADESGFEPRWYGGFGFGISHLEPETNNTGFSVSDDSSNGWKLYGGYDWSNKISIEAYYADIGEAGLSPNGKVEYKDIGLSGLYYFYNRMGDQARDQRKDLSFFGKAGLGFMKNDSDVAYDRKHDTHIMLGAGAEYGFDNGLALRAEIELFDEDSQFYSISLLKRFGKSSKSLAKTTPILTPAPTKKEVIIIKDTDNDGIQDSRDKCPKTRAGAKVDQQGCQIGDVIILKGVLFETGSARLKDVSTVVLDQAVTTLKRYPEMKVEVAGHTDNRGSAAFNRKLSHARANTVRDYLIENGVEAGRMTAKGYGESSPIAGNDTSEGRTVNRRVELIVQE